ncbi:MAG: branched-chain amino acid ABC transporter permease [Betaproteobacteria bacterium]|nr:branched-chain amino acid ABC transporter permease [Betaproteobacteria bacterium]
MDFQIAALLAQDGLTNGAIYALLALALVLVFGVTRVIFVPQGEFVAFGALTLAALQMGKTPGTVWLLLGMTLAAAVLESYRCGRAGTWRRWPREMLVLAAFPLAVALASYFLAPLQLPLWAQVLLTFCIITPMGPLLYRLAFQPVAEASVLVLLILAVAIHFVFVGLGLFLFGAEGSRTPPFGSGGFEALGVNVSNQALWVYAVSSALIVALYLFFGRTIFGKALRATAMNRVGARLIGASPNFAGRLTFTLAAALGAASGVLIGPITTVYYDSGFLIGLKGFVGAIIGGLVSYPIAALGALLVGLLESYASFWASAYKEIIVFTLIIPVLLWRSLTTTHHEEEE